MTPPRLVAFDLDGTLVDSRADLATAANRMLSSYGFAPLSVEAVAAMVGEGARLLVERVFGARGVPPGEVPTDALTRYLAHYDACLVDETTPYDRAVEIVHTIASRVPVAVVTNKPAAPAARLLEHFGFAPAVSALVGGDGPHPRKPDPASLLALMQQFDAPGASTVLVGDSRLDLAAARRAGARAICAVYGFGAAAIPEADLVGVEVLSTPGDLPAALGFEVPGD